MATETVENYIKAIYAISREAASGEAGMSRIAGAVGVTTGTATSMVKKLALARLARYERFGGVTLTPKGQRAALDILRRHRLVETFLVRTLKLDWAEVHDEAERLEHALSPRVIEALDAFLGYPAADPHGDPIPDRRGQVREARLTELAGCAAGARARIERVLDQRPEALRFLRAHGLEIGAVVVVRAVEPGAGTVTVSVGVEGGERVSLSTQAAARVLVHVLDAPNTARQARAAKA